MLYVVYIVNSEATPDQAVAGMVVCQPFISRYASTIKFAFFFRIGLAGQR